MLITEPVSPEFEERVVICGPFTLATNKTAALAILDGSTTELAVKVTVWALAIVAGAV